MEDTNHLRPIAAEPPAGTEELLSPEGPARLLDELCRLAGERAAAEKNIEAGFAERNQAAENEYQSQRRLLEENYQAEKSRLEAEYATAKKDTEEKYRTEHAALEKEYKTVRAEILAKYEAERQAAEQALQDAHWEAIEAGDAARGGLNLPLKDILAALEDRWQKLETLHREAVAILERHSYWDGPPPDPPVEMLLEKHPGHRFCHALEQAQSQFRALSKRSVLYLFHGPRMLVVFLLLWLPAIYPWARFFGWEDWRWAAFSGTPAAVISVVLGVWAYRRGKRQALEKYLALRRTLLEAGFGRPGVLEAAKEECRRLDAAIIARHKEQIQQADKRFAETIAHIEERRREELRRADELYPKRLAELKTRYERIINDLEQKYPPLLARLKETFVAESQRAEEQHRHDLEESRRRYQLQWEEMAEQWRSGMARIFQLVDAGLKTAEERFSDWNGPAWKDWAPPQTIPTAIPFGHARVKLSDVPGGMPENAQLRPKVETITLPVLTPFPSRSLLLLKAAGEGRAKAVELMQSVMLRMLTALPPAKVRFTIIDPVGLGENFSAFMHLADFDEQLVSSRIWTDAVHIETRLADLTKHMENVIQVYLRKEFASIEEYNAFAGELSEPYRVLVVADFPANFNESAVQRLKSIVASGARCGVFVLMSLDQKAPVPRNLQLRDLEAEALSLQWSEGCFLWRHAQYGPLRVEYPAPPPVERFKEIVRQVGEAARDSGRVEVPFSCTVPPEEEWWTMDTRNGILVPLGRAGALKLQYLDLGHGTSQHVLVSGKTGSGKSTLLHVLITNLALRYSPEEVELYLVDFKKGVEFKAYSRSTLPHARVVAIESEREFGLSVLQRLDAELRARGDLLRARGLQDIRSYRAAQPDAKLPRILLIIDEFQELFVEDDRIAQESALLLDRLVRQGRAFGIHVLLGSQTLGGAYTLARSTIGQMAVRIALQCSEADAHLILSEENTAARLLSRPGEAIYNDANGLYEGNHPFQVVWLPDHERDAYLERISRLARQKNYRAPQQIVFEGNVLADLSDNRRLEELLSAADWSPHTPALTAWLGAAVAIKDPTAALFLRQNGGNLLLVGHREEAALGVMASCLFSLAAQRKPQDGKFFILDGMRGDAPEVGVWKRLAAVLPHTVKIASVRDCGAVIEELYAALCERQTSPQENPPSLFLLLYNLGRFRDLRKEDEFGYGSEEEATTLPRRFAALLREGPVLGVHAIVWCDTYANLIRILDRRNLQDFELRVLFQMNANDSSSLMDSPEASRLGVHRAIYYDDGQGVLEKFRPYGLPAPEYLTRVRTAFFARTNR